MLRTAFVAAAVLAFTAPAAFAEEVKPQASTPVKQTAVTTVGAAQGTPIKIRQSGYSGCGWSSAAAPVS